MKKLLLLLKAFSLSQTYAQKKVVLLQNLWNNELTNFTPRDFLDQFFADLKKEWKFSTLTEDTVFFHRTPVADSLNQEVVNYVRGLGTNTDTYYLSLASDLRLPLINIGRIIFKQPVQRSRFTFIVKLFDYEGKPVVSDTVVNKGCVARPAEGEKIRNFYPDYTSFATDMECHLVAIRQQVFAKPLNKAAR